MVNNQLKKEIDELIGHEPVFGQEQKDAIYTKYINGGTQPMKKSYRPFAIATVTLAMMGILVTMLLTLKPFNLNTGDDHNPDSQVEPPVDTEEPIEDENQDEEQVDQESPSNEEPPTEFSSLALTEELNETYNQFSQSQDEALLQNLGPFDIFRLYHESLIQFDLKTQYALYYQEEEFFPYESFESFSENSEVTEVGKENYKKVYDELLTIDHFEVEYLSENEAVIHYVEPYQGNSLSVPMFKNSQGIWKVAWREV